MSEEGRAFLTAEWKYLAMLNYEVDPSVLLPHVPPNTELDSFDGKTFASMVGFLFLDTRVLRVPLPFHRNFEEINLRFYVRYKSEEGWRRGVVFIKEIVPRTAIAWVARTLYGENYQALPTRSAIEFEEDSGARPRQVSYEWRHAGFWNRLSVWPVGEARLLEDGSEEEFITEHYWGYSSRNDGSTIEYRVAHPRWRVWAVEESMLDCDIRALYGEQFEQFLNGRPSSAFLAEGSEIAVYPGIQLVRR